jgi:hypothetical protein
VVSSPDNYFDRLYRSRNSAYLAGQIAAAHDADRDDPGPGRVIDAWRCVDCNAMGELQSRQGGRRPFPPCPVCREGELQQVVAYECACGRLFSTQQDWREHVAEGC